MERRLAAILAADMVGCSRVMEQDEAGTLAALKARRRDVVDPLVAKHRGRWSSTIAPSTPCNAPLIYNKAWTPATGSPRIATSYCVFVSGSVFDLSGGRLSSAGLASPRATRALKGGSSCSDLKSKSCLIRMLRASGIVNEHACKWI